MNHRRQVLLFCLSCDLMNPFERMRTKVYDGTFPKLIHFQAEKYDNWRKMKYKCRQVCTRQADEPCPDIVVYHSESGVSTSAQESGIHCHLITCADCCNGQYSDKLTGQLCRTRSQRVVDHQNRPLGEEQNRTRDNTDDPMKTTCKVCITGLMPVIGSSSCSPSVFPVTIAAALAAP